jgi:hypothetical protein
MINLKNIGGGGSIKFQGPPVPYTIGESALGGKIAYILQSGDPGYDANVQHGFVATVSDISTGAQWGCHFQLITGTSTAIGTGAANTAAIVAQCAEAGIAAKLCDNLVEGGYSDWYLPSRDELTQLYNNRVAIENFSSTVFSYYWSSTQSSENPRDAWGRDFNNGYSDAFETYQSVPFRIRAIRSF